MQGSWLSALTCVGGIYQEASFHGREGRHHFAHGSDKGRAVTAWPERRAMVLN
jgi:hypothetical protein